MIPASPQTLVSSHRPKECILIGDLHMSQCVRVCACVRVCVNGDGQLVYYCVVDPGLKGSTLAASFLGFFFVRQLSEENANLQVNVEKESNEKKRLSRTNEELLWRLQTGELSPRMSPSSSPIHRASSMPGSPARPHSYHQ